jgi:hypothetical protein
MIDPTTLTQAPAQSGWDGFVAAGQQLVYSGVSFFCEMVMVAAVFMVMYGLLAHFSHYSKGGAGWIVNGIILAIGISCIYMGVLGASGPPDISIWFRPPA